jgi:Zn-dependent protease/predicted transcriptional regulator
MPTRPGLLIGRIFGIPIYLHASWVIAFVLISLSLESQFAHQYPQWTPNWHWTVGLATSVLFFGSVVFHELCHSVVALRYKIRVVSITLFIFGGLARIGRDPDKAIQEFNIAVAGPVSSYFLAAVFYGLTLLFPTNEIVSAACLYLAGINFVLATFNLLPGFPLDGGRIFRSMVWGWTRDFSRATRVASSSGKLIAYGMILFGIWYGAAKGQWQSGLWTAFIGWFLLNAAQDSVAQLAVRETLTGLRAADVMSQEIPTVSGSISLEDYGREVLRTGRRCHLVTTDERFVGMMNTNALNSVTQDEWASNSVQAVMIPREKILWAAPEEPLLRLLDRLLASDINQMPVVSDDGEGSHIVGMISRDSILRVMQARAELGQANAASSR